MARLRLALCQVDPVVGDLPGNARRVLACLRHCEEAGAELAVFPELTLTGYPPEDLLLKPAFVADNLRALAEVAAGSSSRCAVVVGFVDVLDGDVVGATHVAPGAGRVGREEAVRSERRLRNAVAVCHGGSVVGRYHKRRLPNYGVFDEERWFGPGSSPLQLYDIRGALVGVSICEDLWFTGGPVVDQARGGASLVANVNASPYSVGRVADRLEVIRRRVAEAGCAVAYVNQVGGQDELVFDGASMVVGADGLLLAAAPAYVEQGLVVDLELPDAAPAGTLPVVRLDVSGPVGPLTPPAAASPGPANDATGPGAGGPTRVVVAGSTAALEQGPLFRPHPWALEEEVYGALVIGTRDYLAKNGFTDAVIGLSGGIDSSLVAVVAADALGPGRVHGIAMPSRYSSGGSLADARQLAAGLGIELAVVPIEPAHVAFETMLSPVLGGPLTGLTDENLQSRLRGVVLMAVSNHQGWIVLTTGNKSELATGYSTLYGDSAGGFAVIKDVPKTLVYRLCRYRNAQAGRALVPESVLDKAPSAELRPGQRDIDSLPPYDVLDPILAGLVEEDRSVEEVAARGFDPEVVARVARLVDVAEYKRRQSPPGVRITAKAFGKDRRVPITNGYREPVPVASGAWT